MKQSYHDGYEAKITEIDGMGWNAARDKLNLDYPPGQPWTGSVDAYHYAKGEMQALLDRK